jgi:osmotically-inducible protein OsmY
MNKLTTYAGFLVTTALVAFLALGCNMMQSPEQQADDASITAEVTSKLATDVGSTAAADIEVETTNGVVTLAGLVATPEVRDRAEEIAKSVVGVVRVTNNIQVNA